MSYEIQKSTMELNCVSLPSSSTYTWGAENGLKRERTHPEGSTWHPPGQNGLVDYSWNKVF